MLIFADKKHTHESQIITSSFEMSLDHKYCLIQNKATVSEPSRIAIDRNFGKDCNFM